MPLTSAERAKLIDQYADGPRRLRAALATVPKEAIQWRPKPGDWSAHEVVVHCSDSETQSASRIRVLVSEKDPVIQGYDQEQWAKAFVYHAANLYTALGVVESVRSHTTDLLRRLPATAWLSAGTHSESGPYTAEDWLKMYAEHLEKHSRQVERNVEAWKARA